MVKKVEKYFEALNEVIIKEIDFTEGNLEIKVEMVMNIMTRETEIKKIELENKKVAILTKKEKKFNQNDMKTYQEDKMKKQTPISGLKYAENKDIKDQSSKDSKKIASYQRFQI